MSRKFIVALAAVAALGMSTLIATDASARFGGGGGGHFSGGHASFSRTSFHAAHINTGRAVTRTMRTNRVTNVARVNRPNLHRPNLHHVHYAQHHHNHHWWWCRHHHLRCGGYPWYVGGYGDDVTVEAAVATPQLVAATPAAAVCTNDCDYFLNNEPGCYMAKRAFSTPQGDELRCVKICEEPANAPK